MLKLLFLILFTPPFIFSQTKIIYTSVDYVHEEVRAAISDSAGKNKTDLGFSKTYLPVWFGSNILFNSDTYIWQCDTTGNNLTQVMPGFRVSVSNDKKKFAFYNAEGIGISDSSLKIIKQVYVEPWEDVTITWTQDDDKISFYNKKKEQCFLFNLSRDSIIEFGSKIIQPLWHLNNSIVLYNRGDQSGRFDVVLFDEASQDSSVISQPDEMALVPVWSSGGDKIAYLSIKEGKADSLGIITDMIFADLILYDLQADEKKILTADAGFTDKAFPQMFFDEEDSYLYYTAITGNGTGALAKINLETFWKTILIKEPLIDERFPHVKTF